MNRSNAADWGKAFIHPRVVAGQRAESAAEARGAMRIISFGYGHGAPPPAHITVDVRVHFRDPHVNPDLRNLTAADQRVIRAVMSTPGVRPLITSILGQVRAYQMAHDPAPVTVAVGCAGGRHRSPVIASEVARRLGSAATVTHRDIGRPVIERHLS